MAWESATTLGAAALLFLVVLLVGKILTVLEIKSKEQLCRKNLHQIADIEDDLETSRRKYLIALKAEGVAKNRVSQLRTNVASLKQHMAQIELTAAQENARKKREKEQAVEMAVLDAMGGTSHRDNHFLRVMKIIRQLINLDEHQSNDEVVRAVKQALSELGKNGTLLASEEIDSDETPVSERVEVSSS